MEIWKAIEIEGVEPWYEVSNLGRVRSNKGKQKILKPWLQSGGYQQVGLRKKDKDANRGYHTALVHRLVADAFLLPPAADQNQINHKNGDKSDNYIQNLEWVTARENIVHSVETGLNARRPRTLLHVPTGTYHSVQQALFLSWLPNTQQQAQIFYHRVRRGHDLDWAVVPDHLIPLDYHKSRYIVRGVV